MSRRSLPRIDHSRREFGFNRTACTCPDCTRYCRVMPGYLIPTDLDRIRHFLGTEAALMDWAAKALRASPGAIVMEHGRIQRIRTLVPARQLTGACVFLTAANRCAIHAVAPFGCAFFDAHMPGRDANWRSRHGLQAVVDAWRESGPYAKLWINLDRLGLRAVSPDVARRRLGHV
jgi:hypothetical protein